MARYGRLGVVSSGEVRHGTARRRLGRAGMVRLGGVCSGVARRGMDRYGRRGTVL